MSNIFTSNWKHFLALSSYFWKNFFSEPHICFLFCFFVSFFVLTVMFRNTTTCQMWDKPGLAVKRNRKRRNKRRSYESRQKGAEARHLGMKVLQVWFSVVQIWTGIDQDKTMMVSICGYSNQWQIEEVKKREGKSSRADFLKNSKYE